MLNQILGALRRISLFLTESWSTLLLGAGLIFAYLFKRRGEKVRELENKLKRAEFDEHIKELDRVLTERKKESTDADKILKDKLNSYDESYKQYIESRRRLAERNRIRGNDEAGTGVQGEASNLQGTVEGDPRGPKPSGSHNFDL